MASRRVDPRHQSGDAKSRDLPNKEIALSLAREWMRDVLKIEGPNGVVIDSQQILSWVAASPR